MQTSKPEVATVVKLGVLKALSPGTAHVSIYSWDDATPVAANVPETFSRHGVQDSITVEVKHSGDAQASLER